VFIFLCNKLNFIVFLSHEKKIAQILESSARKFNTLERNGLAIYGGHMGKAKGQHNSNFLWWSPAVQVIQVSLYMGSATAGVYSEDVVLIHFQV